MKIFLSLILLIAVASAFQIRLQNEEIKGEINDYPFNNCGTTNMSYISFTLDPKPTLNINLTATVVGKANKDIAFNYVRIAIQINFLIIITSQEDYNITYNNGEIINFVYTYEIPQYQQKGFYTVIFQFIDTDNIREGCIYYSYML